MPLVPFWLPSTIRHLYHTLPVQGASGRQTGHLAAGSSYTSRAHAGTQSTYLTLNEGCTQCNSARPPADPGRPLLSMFIDMQAPPFPWTTIPICVGVAGFAAASKHSRSRSLGRRWSQFTGRSAGAGLHFDPGTQPTHPACLTCSPERSCVHMVGCTVPLFVPATLWARTVCLTLVVWWRACHVFRSAPDDKYGTSVWVDRS